MNKLFTKIAALFLGATMATGVGVAVAVGSKEATEAQAAGSSDWVQVTALTGLNTTDTYVIANDADKGYFMNGSVSSGHFQGTAFGASAPASATAAGAFKLEAVNATDNIYKIKLVSTNKYVKASKAASGGGTVTDSSDSAGWKFLLSGTSFDAIYQTAYSSKYAAMRCYNNTSWRTYQNGSATSISTTSGTVFRLYKYSQSYTLSFNANGGAGTVPSNITGSGSKTLPSSASLTKTGYTLDGWGDSSHKDDASAQYALGASYTLSSTTTLYAHWTLNSYTVGGTITNGSLSSTASVTHGSPLSITINPNGGYKHPGSLTSVTMGGSAYAGYTYNSGTGAFSITSVTGNVVINATCPVDATTYTITGSITDGSLTGDTGEQAEGGDYVVQVSPTTLHKYPTSVTVTGAGVEDTGWEYDSSDGLVYIYGLSANVTVTASCPDASITSISVSGPKTSFILGEEFSFGGTVKASYDDVAGSTNVTISTDLVDFDSSAYDPFVESNSYTIGVSLKADDSVSTSYTVSVTRKSITTITTYVKVSASKSDWSGKYVFMNANNGHVMGTTISSDRVANGTTSDIKNSSGNTITESDTVIASGYTNYVYTITKVGDYYTISPDAGTNAGKFLAGTGVKNKAQFLANTDTSDYRLWTITYSSGFVITNKYNAAQSINAVLRCNDDSGWAAYGGSQATNGAPCLFEKTETPSGTRSLIRITATGPAANVKKEEDIVTAADFTVTALYDTAETGTATSNVSVVSGATLVAGSNTVTLSYTEGPITKTCEVIVIAAENTAELDGIVWSQENVTRTVFAGATIGSFGTLEKHYDDGSTIALPLNECSVAVYSNTSGTVAHEVADPTSYTWSLSNDNGKYLGVTYEGYTLYSGVINVVETINPVYGKEEVMTFKTKASDSNPIAVGDKVVFAYDDANMEMVSVTSGTKGVVETFTTNPAGTYPLTVVAGNAEGTFAFKDSENNYISYTQASGTTGKNYLYLQSTLDNMASWTISYDGTDVTITNVNNNERSLRYNTTATQERISAYISSSTTFPLIQVYKGENEWVPVGTSIANTNAVVQKAVLEYAAHFNETMNCVNGGTTANVSGKWSTLSSDFDDALAAFSGSDLAHFKALYAGADAVENGDTLQDMLARYEYICAKYKLDDFLADIDRPPVAQKANITLFGLNNVGSDTITTIVIISIISISMIAGYFFIRKRKEENI